MIVGSEEETNHPVRKPNSERGRRPWSTGVEWESVESTCALNSVSYLEQFQNMN